MKIFTMIRNLFLFLLVVFTATSGYCQDIKQVIGEVSQVYTGSDGSGNGLIGGFSLWGLLAGIIFSSVGFVAFVYGKKNSEFRPMLIGIALMVYPYFLRGTLGLFLVGVGLTAVLYFFRE